MRPHLRIGSVMLAAVAAFALLPPAPATAASGEFNSPSATSPVAKNVYNTTPSCGISAPGRYCYWPSRPPIDSDNPEGYGVPGGPWYNCAYWTAEKRPDLEVYAIQKYGYGSDGGAYHWKDDAVAAGYPVTHIPTVGAIEVIYPPYGSHAEYVEKVYPDGSYIVSSANFNNGSTARYWAYPSEAKQNFFIQYRHQIPVLWRGQSGTSKAGSTDRIAAPTLAGSGWTISYRWFVGGTQVSTNAALWINPNWRGKSVVGKVTITKSGWYPSSKNYYFPNVS